MPSIDETAFQHEFVDGDELPIVKTFSGNDTQWEVAVLNDGSASRVWIEPPTASTAGCSCCCGTMTDEKARLRVQLAPGVTGAEVTSVVVSCLSGQSQPVRFSVTTPFEYRTYTGRGNNLTHPLWGAADQTLPRLAPANYADGKSEMVQFANPRGVSNAVSRYTDGAVPPESLAGLSDMVWAWGQFIDHEIGLTHSDKTLAAPIVAPDDDPNLPDGVISFFRSQHRVDDAGTWQQINSISSFLDASNVYGSSEHRAYGLRTLDGTGKLKTSHNGTLPPFNVGAVYENANDVGQVAAADLFLCGDVRANENPLLCAVHALFVLEHNRLCDELLAQNPQWEHDDERLFQEARRIVVALTQHITIDHFLPTLFGEQNALPPYTGYVDTVQPDVCTEFSAALYRVGHTMVSNQLAVRASSAGAPQELFVLADVFFAPQFLVQHGVAALLKGAAEHRMQEIDRFVVEALRNMLFGSPDEPSGALHDLVAINLQRGADHGLPKYNDVREAYGLARKQSLDEVSSNSMTRSALASVYATVDEIDVWIGALCEDKVPGAQLGELSLVAVREQFQRIRDGDRLWYERTLAPDLVAEIQQTTLADIVRRNTDANVADNVFLVPSA